MMNYLLEGQTVGEPNNFEPLVEEKKRFQRLQKSLRGECTHPTRRPHRVQCRDFFGKRQKEREYRFRNCTRKLTANVFK